MIDIAFLLDAPAAIPTLAQWFRAEWPGYYGGRTLADIAQDFHADANRDVLPTRLVAFVEGVLAGTVCLREHPMTSLPEYRPGLGGLLVPAQYRGRGIGSELVRAAMEVAQVQGYQQLYATTATAGNIFQRLGWEQIQTLAHDGQQLGLYRYTFAERDPTAK